MINDEMLEPDLTSEFPDTVHEILALAMNHLRNVVKLVLGHPESCLDALRLLVNLLKLLLLRREIFSKLETHILLGLEVLLHGKLLTAALFELSLTFQKLLLLLHRLFHFFVTAEKLFLHILDLLEQ